MIVLTDEQANAVHRLLACVLLKCSLSNFGRGRRYRLDIAGKQANSLSF